MKKKKIFLICIMILILFVIVACGFLYNNYRLKQKELLKKAIATVDEVNKDNLTVEYDNSFTNDNLELQLSTNTDYDIAYSFNNTDYINYDKVINIEENTGVYIKYINSYGTYSMDGYLIEINNIDKIQPEINKKEITAMTNSLTINVEAIDNIEIARIEVSIDAENYMEVINGSYTFEGLEQGKEYTINIKAIDIAGNTVSDSISKMTEVQAKTSNTNKSSNTNTSTNKSQNNSNNKSNEANSNISTNDSTNSSISNNKSDETKSWTTDTHYGGEIYDSSGAHNGYWEYGEELDLNGIDMSDWTIK